MSGQLADEARGPAMTLGVSHVLAERLRESTEPEARRDPRMRCQPLGESVEIAAGKLRRELAFLVNQLRTNRAPGPPRS